MSIMVAEVYEALVSAGAPADKAMAAAAAIPIAENLATKQDLVEIKVDIAESRAATQQDIAESRAAAQQDKIGRASCRERV